MQLGSVHVAIAADGVAWSAAVHRRSDLSVVSLAISESEGDFPTCELVIDNPAGGPVSRLGATRILASIDTLDDAGSISGTVLLFDGYLIGWPVGAAGDQVTLRYEARRSDWETLRRQTIAAVSTVPAMLTWFGDMTDPVEAFDASPAILHWDRATGLPVMGSIYGTPGFIDLDTNWRRDGLSLDMAGLPLAAVDVVLKAEWDSREFQSISLASTIDAGENGLRTYTPDDLVNDWPKRGDTIADGWTVYRSSVGLVQEGSLEVYQAVNASRSYEPGDDQPVRMNFRRYDVNPILDVIAGRTIGRTETVTFRMSNAGQAATRGDIEKVELTLSGLTRGDVYPEWKPDTDYGFFATVSFAGFVWECGQQHRSTTSLWADLERWNVYLQDGSALGSPAAATFFNSPNGRLAIDHAVLVATTKIAASQRCVEARISCDLVDALHVRCAMAMRLAGDKIPAGDGSSDGVMTGKVTSYTIRLGSGLADVDITLAASAGSGVAGAGHLSLYPADWASVGYGAPDYQVLARNFGPIAVAVSYGDEAQKTALLAGVSSGNTDLANLLQDIPTVVEFNSPPNEGGETSIALTVMPSPYQGPRQVEL